jgi:hypothetical protein
MKELVNLLRVRYPDLKTRFLTALQTLDPHNLWPPMVARHLRSDGTPIREGVMELDYCEE